MADRDPRIPRVLADHLETGEELDIQTAGFTKCRFPMLAKRYVVRDGDVLHADLSSANDCLQYAGTQRDAMAEELW